MLSDIIITPVATATTQIQVMFKRDSDNILLQH